MNSRDFIYWLQGYLEITDPLEHSNQMSLLPEQIKVIKDHIALVLEKETPNYQITINPPIDVSQTSPSDGGYWTNLNQTLSTSEDKFNDIPPHSC